MIVKVEDEVVDQYVNWSVLQWDLSIMTTGTHYNQHSTPKNYYEMHMAIRIVLFQYIKHLNTLWSQSRYNHEDLLLYIVKMQ